MKAIDRRTPSPGLMFLMAWVLLGTSLSGPGPAPSGGRRATADPDRSRGDQEESRERQEPASVRVLPVEVAPFDVLPYVKANHWCTLLFELRANDDDYDGFLQTDPVKLLGRPQQVYYRREARLLKEKRATLSSSDHGSRGEWPGSQGTGGGDGPPQRLAARRELAGDPDDPAAPPDAGPGPEQGCDDQVRGLESDVGDDSLGGRPRRRRHREAALLPARLADGARQAGAFRPIR